MVVTCTFWETGMPKFLTCVGCGGLVPTGEAAVSPFDTLLVICQDCERSRVEEEEREHEERESAEVERVYRADRYSWDRD